MSWFEKGNKDARSGREPDEPKRDVVDRLAGYTGKDENDWKRDYKDGYKSGSSQRVADSNTESSSSSDGGSGK